MDSSRPAPIPVASTDGRIQGAERSVAADDGMGGR